MNDEATDIFLKVVDLISSELDEELEDNRKKYIYKKLIAIFEEQEDCFILDAMGIDPILDDILEEKHAKKELDEEEDEMEESEDFDD